MLRLVRNKQFSSISFRFQVPQASVSNPITYGKEEEEEDATYMGQMNPAFQENAVEEKQEW